MKLPRRPTKLPPPLKRECYRFRHMPFNPRQKATIHNPYPEKKWPFPIGTPVYCFKTNGACDPADVFIGRVIYYNPARNIDASCVTSPGLPSIAVLDCQGHHESLSPREVKPCTRAGWLDILRLIADEARTRGERHRAQADAETTKARNCYAYARALDEAIPHK